MMVKEWKSRVVVRYHGWGEEQQEELDLTQIRPVVRKRKKKTKKKTRPAKKKKRKPRDRQANAVNCVDASAL